MGDSSDRMLTRQLVGQVAQVTFLPERRDDCEDEYELSGSSKVISVGGNTACITVDYPHADTLTPNHPELSRHFGPLATESDITVVFSSGSLYQKIPTDALGQVIIDPGSIPDQSTSVREYFKSEFRKIEDLLEVNRQRVHARYHDAEEYRVLERYTASLKGRKHS